MLEKELPVGLINQSSQAPNMGQNQKVETSIKERKQKMLWGRGNSLTSLTLSIASGLMSRNKRTLHAAIAME